MIFFCCFLFCECTCRYERIQCGDYVRDWGRRLIHSGRRAGRLVRHNIDLHHLLHDGYTLPRLRTQGQSIVTWSRLVAAAVLACG